MNELLLEFEKSLANLGANFISRLQSGNSLLYVKETLSKIDVYDEALIEFYTWKNGTSKSDYTNSLIEELEILPDLIMLSVEDAVEAYSTNTKENKIWPPRMVPLFTNGGGDYLLLQIDPEIETSGMIFLFAPSLLLSELPQTIYDSLDKFFLTAIQCIEKGAFTTNIKNEFEIDYDLKYKISYDINPKSDYWKNSL